MESNKTMNNKNNGVYAFKSILDAIFIFSGGEENG